MKNEIRIRVKGNKREVGVLSINLIKSNKSQISEGGKGQKIKKKSKPAKKILYYNSLPIWSNLKLQTYFCRWLPCIQR